jgi:hypothetical protein
MEDFVPATGDQQVTPPPTPRPVLGPEAIQARETTAAEALPGTDQEAVARSAGEGMVGTTVEAAAQLVRHINQSGRLLAPDGRFVAMVEAELQVIAAVWSGTICPDGDVTIVPGDYDLQLNDGRRLRITVTGQATDRYTIEGEDMTASR